MCSRQLKEVRVSKNQQVEGEIPAEGEDWRTSLLEILHFSLGSSVVPVMVIKILTG